jgi:stearoyl-CoA desaturase (delta-9 desaturase)
MIYLPQEHFLKTLMKFFNKRTKYTYWLVSILSHLLFVVYCYYFGLSYLIVSLLIGLFVFNVAAELFMHRAISHKQFKFSSGLNNILLVLFSMCNFGSIASNSAIHLTHHKYSDTVKDPHDYKNIGLFNMIVKNWSDDYPINKKILCSFLKDKNIRNQHNNHLKWSLVSAIFFPFIPVASFWLINLLFIISHLGKNEENRSINLPILYPLMWGAEMHKDHHKNISKNRMHRYDIIYAIGKTLEKL